MYVRCVKYLLYRYSPKLNYISVFCILSISYIDNKIIKGVIPQVRTITRYGTGSVILFDYAESPNKYYSKDSA